jgi:hypothetical protein
MTTPMDIPTGMHTRDILMANMAMRMGYTHVAIARMEGTQTGRCKNPMATATTTRMVTAMATLRNVTL